MLSHALFFPSGFEGMWIKRLGHCKVEEWFYGFANTVGDWEQIVECNYREESGAKHVF